MNIMPHVLLIYSISLTIATRREKPEALICYPLHTMPSYPQ